MTFAETRAEAEKNGFRPCRRCRPDRLAQGPLARRIEAIDMERAAGALLARGFARLGFLLSADECAALAASYATDALYRSTVVMTRAGFGEGEYRYFADPAPTLVGELRAGLYARLAPQAAEFAARLGRPRRYPAAHAAYRAECAAVGQSRPTPLILRYREGGYNRLHQDLYGGEAFPIQVVIALSEPGRDYEGGDFILCEQTPRRQSRAEAIRLEQGEALAFAVDSRPAAGAKGTYRARLRHGVSTVLSGERFALGLIFHDAA